MRLTKTMIALLLIILAVRGNCGQTWYNSENPDSCPADVSGLLQTRVQVSEVEVGDKEMVIESNRESKRLADRAYYNSLMDMSKAKLIAGMPIYNADHLPGKANSQDDVWISAINASHPDSPGLLVTTAYWKIRSKRGEPEASDSVYRKCMMQVLSLNTPMVVYGDAQALTEMGEARRSSNVPPLVGQVQMKIDDLTPCSGHPEIWSHPQKYTNDGDVPSVELGCIWDGKPSLLRQSAHEHPEYDWYAWLDVCMGHGDIPFRHGERLWPSSERLQTLPKDRITVSLSNEHMCETCRAGWTYCHCLAGTAFVVPKPLVDRLANKFSQKVDACLQSFSSSEDGAYICMSDQVIMTKLFLDEPDMFSIGSSGYGAVATQQLSSIPNILEYHASRDPVVGMRAALDPHRCDGHRDGVRGCRDCCGTNNFDDPCVDSCMKAD